MRIHNSLAAALLLTASVVLAADRPAPAPTAVADRRTTIQIITYYFHGTVRCETCLKIEQQARAAIEGRFPFELAEKRLVFKSVDYDKRENAHFLKDYKLQSPSLVVVRQKGGKDERWKLLDEIWEYVRNPLAFNEYVKGEVNKFLQEEK